MPVGSLIIWASAHHSPVIRGNVSSCAPFTQRQFEEAPLPVERVLELNLPGQARTIIWIDISLVSLAEDIKMMETDCLTMSSEAVHKR